MARREGPVDPARATIAEFAEQLRGARRAAGCPTYREMAARTYYSHEYLSKAAKGRALPTWECVQAYLRACGVEDPDQVQAWRARWETARHATRTALGVGGRRTVTALAPEVEVDGAS
jgi:hypothetical protein